MKIILACVHVAIDGTTTYEPRFEDEAGRQGSELEIGPDGEMRISEPTDL